MERPFQFDPINQQFRARKLSLTLHPPIPVMLWDVVNVPGAELRLFRFEPRADLVNPRLAFRRVNVEFAKQPLCSEIGRELDSRWAITIAPIVGKVFLDVYTIVLLKRIPKDAALDFVGDAGLLPLLRSLVQFFCRFDDGFPFRHNSGGPHAKHVVSSLRHFKAMHLQEAISALSSKRSHSVGDVIAAIDVNKLAIEILAI